MKVQISEHADLQGLAFNMVMQALRDLKNKRKPEKQADALLWITSADFGIWAEVWGLPFADSYLMLTSGAAKKFKYRENHDR